MATFGSHPSAVICNFHFFHLHWPAAVLMQCFSVAKNNRWKETSISSHNSSCKVQCLFFFQKYCSVEKKSITAQKISVHRYVAGSVPFFFLFNQWWCHARIKLEKANHFKPLELMGFCCYDWLEHPTLFSNVCIRCFVCFSIHKIACIHIRSSRLAQIKPVKRTILYEWIWNFKKIVQEKVLLKVLQ